MRNKHSNKLCNKTKDINICLISYHFANNDDFWSHIFVNGGDVNETEREDNVVDTKDTSSNLIGRRKHPEAHGQKKKEEN